MMTDQYLAERLSRLEGSLDGMRHAQNMTFGAVLGVGAILAALMIYMVHRIDNLPNKLDSISRSLAP